MAVAHNVPIKLEVHNFPFKLENSLGHVQDYDWENICPRTNKITPENRREAKIRKTKKERLALMSILNSYGH